MLTTVLLALVALVVVILLVVVLVMGVSSLVYGTGGTRTIMRDFVRGRFEVERRPWWDFFGFTDESDVIYPPKDTAAARHDDGGRRRG